VTSKPDAQDANEEVQGGPETDGDGTGDQDGHHLSLEAVNDRLDELMEKVSQLGRRRPSSAAERGTDVAEQVRGEVAKIKAAESRQGQGDRLGALETAVKAITEKAPKEYRRITRVLWGDDEESSA
jgi:hypothetical protein